MLFFYLFSSFWKNVKATNFHFWHCRSSLIKTKMSPIIEDQKFDSSDIISHVFFRSLRLEWFYAMMRGTECCQINFNNHENYNDKVLPTCLEFVMIHHLIASISLEIILKKKLLCNIVMIPNFLQWKKEVMWELTPFVRLHYIFVYNGYKRRPKAPAKEASDVEFKRTSD